jgi:ankyrin repeat protein
MQLPVLVALTFLGLASVVTGSADVPTDADLIRVVTSKDEVELRTLLAAPQRVNVDAVEEYGRTLLHLAIERDFEAGVRLLCSAGADVEKTTDHRAGYRAGETALHYASAAGHGKIVTILIEHGADPLASNAHGMSPLHLAAGLGRLDVVKALLGTSGLVRVDVKAENDYGSTPLHLAATSMENGLAAIHAMRMLGAPTDLNVRNLKGSTMLHAAASAGNVDIVEYVLEHGGDASVLDENDLTPLAAALERATGDPELKQNISEIEAAFSRAASRTEAGHAGREL